MGGFGRFFSLRIVFVVVFLILLMSFCVLEYRFVDVGLFCINYLVIGLGLSFLFVVLLVAGEKIGGFVVIAKTMLWLQLIFIDHFRCLE